MPRLDDYLRASEDGLAEAVDVESPDFARALRERIWTGLRLREGLDSEAILKCARALSADAGKRLATAVAEARDEGMLTDTGGRWVLTERGMLLADGIVVDFMAALEK